MNKTLKLATGIMFLAACANAQTKYKFNVALVSLSLSSQASIAADEYTTLQLTQPRFQREKGGIIIVTPPSGIEADPFARPFVNLPKPAYYATGALLSGGMTYWSMNLRKKKKWWWWAPQVSQTVLSGFLAYHNSRLMR